jgi:hypothetical protein
LFAHSGLTFKLQDPEPDVSYSAGVSENIPPPIYFADLSEHGTAATLADSAGQGQGVVETDF